MRTIINILFTTLFVLVLANYLPGVHVKNFSTALIVALVLGLLNIFVKPILVLLTLPATIFTLGLFLLVINAVIVMLCAYLVPGFKVDTFLQALIFSLILSLCQSVLDALYKEDK